ncbi:MAG: hypothetical protein GX275_02665, partial [Clostridiales bacterium]|nr:hypothetical protein [Clostridiales bacterium]
LKKVYKPEILSLKENNNILEQFYKMILMVRNIIINSKNKLEYIKDFKKLIKEYSIYSKILKVFIQNISEEPISEEMIKEKLNLLKVVEEYYYLGKVEEGFSILNELEQIFNNDIDVINLKGVGHYYLGNYKKALINLAFVYEMKEDKFEAAYNIAMIFEEIKRNDDAKYFYNVAFNLCKDNEIKKEIEPKLK